MILVTGATGTNGRHLVRELLARGASVRAVVRQGSGSEAGFDPRVEVVKADLDQPGTLPPALAGIKRAFLLTANTPTQLEQERAFIDAAKAAGVELIVKFSARGAESADPDPIARLHRQAERHLEASGVPFTILRNSFFMQNLLWFAPQIKAEGRFRLPTGDGRVALIDARDIAVAAAMVLVHGGHDGKSFTLSGPESLSFSQVAEEMSAALGRTISFDAITPAEFKAAAMRDLGLPEPFADVLGETYDRLSHGSQAGVTSDAATLAGSPQHTVGQFTRDHAAAFQA